MATTTGTFPLKGDDLGNAPYFYDGWLYASNNTFISGNSGGLSISSFTDYLDQYIYYINQSFTGTITYTYTGPGTWNAGSDTVVTFTFTNIFSGSNEVIPYFVILGTESYNYAVIWEAAAPAVPTLCNTCQLIQLTQCGNNSFYLDLGLADGSYTAYYTDNTSGVIWEQGTYSSTAQGGLYMYQWEATAGMFNQYSFYTLTIRDTNGDAVSWIVNDVEYTCATLTFKTTVNVTD